MHFHVGKAAHDKLVTCIKGRVLNVVVDVRPESPNSNQDFSVERAESSNTVLMMGKSYSHGFLSLTADIWMFYSIYTVRCPSQDRRMFWISIPFDWPGSQPLLSDRDEHHPSIQELL